MQQIKKVVTAVLAAAALTCLLAAWAFAFPARSAFAADGSGSDASASDRYVIGDDAYETLDMAVKAVPTDNTQTTITFVDGNGDKMLSGNGVQVKAGQNIVFDYSGNTYEIDGATVGSPTTETNGFQLLKGSTVTMRDGKVTSEKAKILIQNYCDLTLEDMTLEGADVTSYVVSNNSGTTVISGETNILAAEGNVAFDLYYWPSNGYVDGVRVIFDESYAGTVEGTIEYTTDGKDKENWFEKAELEIGGAGNFDVTLFVQNVSGTDAAEANISVSGGTFANGLREEYIADGSLLCVNSDGRYVVGDYEELAAGGSVAVAVGKIGYASLEEAVKAGVAAVIEKDGIDEGYLSLEEAVAAAQVGETVKLVANVTLSSMLTVDEAIVLDLNGFDITGGSTNKNFVIKVAAGGVVITNGAAEESVVKTGSVEIIGIAVASGLDSAVTIENITVSIDDVRTGSGNLAGIQTQSATELSNVRIAVRGSYDLIMGILAAGADVTVRDSQFAVYRNEAANEAEVHAIHAQNDSNITLIGSTVESNDAGVVFIGSYADGNAAAQADVSAFCKLTVENSTIRTDSFAVCGNGLSHGTNIEIKGSELVSQTAAAIYHPQYGEITVIDSTITGISGIELRAGKAFIQSGTITATGDPLTSDPNGNGSTTVGGAIVLAQHTTKLPAEVVVTGGTFKGVYAFYQADVENNGADAEKVQASLRGGVFEGKVWSETLTGFISGGKYLELPAEEAFAEGFAGELYNGYYVVVESGTEDVAGLLAAQLNAQAEVRTYAAALGLSWTRLQKIADAADILQEYALIENATSMSAVAVAKISAMDAIDAYMAALEAYRSEAVRAVEEAAAADEVVVPTATYAAINGAVSKDEVDAYMANALGEIEAIVGLRAQVEAQAQELENVSAAIRELKDSFVGGNSQLTAFLNEIRDAIDAAKEELADGTSESLQAVQAALEAKIDEGTAAAKAALAEMQKQLSEYAEEVRETATLLKETLEGQNAAMQADMEALRASIAGIQEDVDALAAALDAESGNWADMAADIADVKAAVDGISSSVNSTIEAARDAITQKIEETEDADAFVAVYVLVSIALVLSAAAVVLLVVVLLKRPKVVAVSETSGKSDGEDAE